MRGRSGRFRSRRRRAARLDLHLLQPDLVRPLQQALLACLGAGALGILQLEQEHQRAVVVDHLLADLLALEEIRPRARLAGTQLEVVGFLPETLGQDLVAAVAETLELGAPAPHRAFIDADAGGGLTVAAAALELIEEAHPLAPATLRLRRLCLRPVQQRPLDRLRRRLDTRRTLPRLLGHARPARLLAGLGLQLGQAHAAHMGGRVKSIAVDPLVIGRLGPAEAVDRRVLAHPERAVLIVK